MADHGHHIAMPARLGAQNAEAVFGIVIGDALDETGQHFLGRCLRLRLHFNGRITSVAAGPASPTYTPSVCADRTGLHDGMAPELRRPPVEWSRADKLDGEA
jgi:hypothetical protein